jgi:hypothetical protein
MNPENTEPGRMPVEALAYAQATNIFLAALLVTHPDPRGVLDNYEHLLEYVATRYSRPEGIPEHFGASVQYYALQLRSMLEAALGPETSDG